MSVADDLDFVDVIENSPIGAVVLGRGEVLFWNSALLRLLGGLDGEGFAAAAVHGFFADPAEFATIRAALDRGQEVRDHEARIIRADGAPRWAAVSLRPIVVGRRAALLGWYFDVTQQRSAALEAERAKRSQSSFLATVSHEIRTPMNGVQTIAELLSGTGLTAEQHGMVRTIKDSADALVAIVDDILDFSKIEAGRLEIAAHPFRPAGVIDDVARLLRPKAEEKGLALACHSTVAAEDWYDGDAMRLRQILLNLVGNAIKFTHAGGVTLRMLAAEPGIRIEVEDTGPGIPQAQAGELFAPFRQADASTARFHGGTGLGLSICKQLATLMGGTIGLRSVRAQGATFWVTLPLPRAAPPGADATTPERRAPHRLHWQAPDRAAAERQRAVVLCAEDNRTNRDVLALVLGRLGIVFDMARTGIEALRLLDRRIHGLLLTDAHMPEMDGWMLARRLRESEAEQGLPRLPIVALTADAIAGIAERCTAAGMDLHLTKPLSLAAVEDAVCRLLPAAAALRARARPADEAAAAERPAIDLGLLADLVGPQVSAIEPMLQNFLDSAPRLAREVADGLARGDAQAAARAAHSLKSASLYVGARALADAAAGIEQAARAGRLAALPDRLAPLDALLRQVATAIAAFRAGHHARQTR